jgi:hypothetical protein
MAKKKGQGLGRRGHKPNRAKRKSNEIYKRENRKRDNKIRKLNNYIKENPNDRQAIEALKRIERDVMWGSRGARMVI